MHKFLIALLVTLGAAVPQTQETQATTASVADTTSPASPVINGTSDQVKLVNEAVRRFTAHGMQLPAVEITFSDSREACGGFRGLYAPVTVPADHSVDQITVCDDWSVYLYHELAHAWEAHSVTDATRAELIDHWHLSTWSDPAEDWEARGIEQAAKTISYALAFDELPVDMDVSRYVCAFELLTGTPLPVEVADVCGVEVTAVDAPVIDMVSTESWVEKNPADDPRLAPPTTAGSSHASIEAPWSWEHEGPGSNSLDAPWLTGAEAPTTK